MGRKKKVSGRRLNGEGSIYQRQDGRWCCQLTIEGKPRYLYGKSPEEVQGKRDEVRELANKGVLPEPNKVTVQQWLKTWMEEYKKDNLKPATYHSYQNLIDLHINPAIGERKVKDLKPSHIQKLISFATIMLEQGVDLETVSTMLGHSSLTITADIYTHVRQEIQSVAANKLNNALSIKKQ